MNPIIDAIFRHSRQTPRAPAIESRGRIITYRELANAIREAGGILRQAEVGRVGISMNNGPSWAIWDLAALYAGMVSIPLNGFFSDSQRNHVIRDAGIQAIVDDRGTNHEIAGYQAGWYEPPVRGESEIFPATVKVTYTSGTTGAPKGVCLSMAAIDKVASSLLAQTNARPGDRHLSALPLSVLLENIAGLYVPLMAGACIVLEPLHAVGLNGSSRFDASQLLDALHEHKASTCIMVPAMLEALTKTLAAGYVSPSRLRLLAVGGGRVSARLINKARGFGLPVYQGYGLSECASVVALNVPEDDDVLTVGRPLQHVELKLADDSEVLIRAPGFLGYLGHRQPDTEWWPTGDLGHLDSQGRLHIDGRKKNIFITAFGRNVSPEWVEAELMAESVIMQAVVLGEQRPFNLAIVVSNAPDKRISAGIAAVNEQLPDYARIGRWIRATEPFTADNGMATPNGIPRRKAIAHHYRDSIDFQYKETQRA